MTADDPFDDVPDDPMADFDRATERLSVRTEERTYGKKIVVVEGFEINVTGLPSEPKRTLSNRILGSIDELRSAVNAEFYEMSHLNYPITFVGSYCSNTAVDRLFGEPSCRAA